MYQGCKSTVAAKDAALATAIQQNSVVVAQLDELQSKFEDLGNEQLTLQVGTALLLLSENETVNIHSASLRKRLGEVHMSGNVVGLNRVQEPGLRCAFQIAFELATCRYH